MRGMPREAGYAQSPTTPAKEYGWLHDEQEEKIAHVDNILTLSVRPLSNTLSVTSATMATPPTQRDTSCPTAVTSQPETDWDSETPAADSSHGALTRGAATEATPTRASSMELDWNRVKPQLDDVPPLPAMQFAQMSDVEQRKADR